MKRTLTGCAMLILSALAVWATQPAGEKTVPLDKVPKAVRATVQARFPNAKWIGASSEMVGEKLIYEVELNFNGLRHDVTLEPNGVLFLIEREIAFKDLPKKVQKTLDKENPNVKYQLIEEVINVKNGKETLDYYEAHFVNADKKEAEVLVLPNGKLKPAAQPESKTTTESGWTTSFAVSKKDLVSIGRNPYFILEPGYQLVLADGDERLVITVLNETKTIDGVETRVVEEHESKAGKIVEISRNFFAICKRTNSVYYFGEEVDIYKNDKIASHEGAWFSGAKGAKFGLYLPGLPLLGAKYYQEMAPGVAMDRAEIVSMSVTMKTKAGEFKNCLKTLETSPLEPNVRDHKVYAPGIGLVQDASAKLVHFGKAEPKAK